MWKRKLPWSNLRTGHRRMALQLNNRVILFFDRAAYDVVVGYEREASR